MVKIDSKLLKFNNFLKKHFDEIFDEKKMIFLSYLCLVSL